MSDQVLKPEAGGAEAPAEQPQKRQFGKAQITFKVSEKGAVSVYGLGRFPVTLYKEQWDRLLNQGEALRQFIRDHEQELKKKE